MSIRRLNFTGRQRIPRERVKIAVDGTPPDATFRATFESAGLGFPGTAQVVLEAQAGWTVQRYELGSVDGSCAISDARLSEFDSLAGLLFRLKVVATGDRVGELLGVADRLRPSGDFHEVGRESFVVVRPQDLGDRVWRLDLDEAQPLLLVNSRIGDHHDFLKRREVAALVLPEVMQRMLEFAADSDVEEDSADGWIPMVLQLGERLAGRPLPDSSETEELSHWVDEAVGAFARRYRLLDAFLADGAGETA